MMSLQQYIMSSTEEQAADVCASCGVKDDVDNVNLKKCTGCDGLVKYCSVGCQKNHWPQHKKACKKRAAEIRDDRLFRQPEDSHLGECPICFLPLPLDAMKYTMKSCCSKYICLGCFYAHTVRQEELSLEPSCPFCREPQPNSQEEAEKANRKRAKANDPIALLQVGKKCHDEGDYEGAFQHWKKAAELGDMSAHYQLSYLYYEGMGVEMDRKKEIYHTEEAAIGGHVKARYKLGNDEATNGNIQRAMKHWIIAANLGYKAALEEVKQGFRRGVVSKEDFEAALRGHQAAVDATKSEKREEAYAFYEV
jgi:tetratricopeptide (TPR) repeat protein